MTVEASDTWRRSLSDHKLRQADRIAHAAIELVFEGGVSALSMSAIARAAGVSRQTLYKYFPDVASVLRVAVQRSSHDTTNIEAADTPADQLAAFVRYVMSAAVAGHHSPAALEPLLDPGARKEIRAHAAQAQQLVAVILRRGQDDGVFRPDLDPDLDADIVYRTVIALSELTARTDDPESMMGRVVRAVLGMVGYTG